MLLFINWNTMHFSMTFLMEMTYRRLIIDLTMNNNQIVIPRALSRDGQFFRKILETNHKVFTHVQYIRQLVTSMHQMYLQLCKSMTHTTEHYQRKIVNACKGSSKHGDTILEFVRALSFLHYCINNQLNSNTVSLGTKTNRIAKNRLDVLSERLHHCESNHKEYIKSVEHFNNDEKQFNHQCQYFSDYEKDVIKYYSLKYNVEKHEKLQRKEIRLKQQTQDIFLKKLEYQQNVHECRTLIKQYFQMQQNLISQYCRLILNVRKKALSDKSQVYAQPIIEEPSNEMDSTSNKIDMLQSRYSQKQLERTIAAMRKDIMKQQEHVRQLESLLENFLEQFTKIIKSAGERIDEIRDDKNFEMFVSEKIQMTDALPVNSIRQIDHIISQISLYRTIVLNLQTHLGKIKVLQEIKKYRAYNYEKFMEETSHYGNSEKKGAVTQSNRTDYYKLEYKYLDRNTELLSNYQERIIELKQSIIAEYHREQISYLEHKSTKNIPPPNIIFTKAYYQILMESFFLNKVNSQNYQQNCHLKKLSTNLAANQIQTTMTLEGFNKKGQGKRWCCGFFGGDEVQAEKPPQIDDFHCSLKDGMVLIRGKLKLYENYLKFSSSFNSKTLFGNSDLRVPKWNIIRITLGKHMLADKIIIQTTHGDLQFTDFFNSPFDLLVQTYETKRSGVTALDKNNREDTEVALLEERFQSQFPADLLKVGIHVDKLSTYLSEDRQKLSISTEYHLTNSSFHSLFEIKIIQKQITIEYIFIHDNKRKNKETKQILQKTSKDLINRKQPQSPPSVLRLGRLTHLDCSIIEAKQQNKLSFVKEPSFFDDNDKKQSAVENGSFNILPELDKKGSPLFSNNQRNSSEQDSNIILKQTSRLSDDGTNPRSSWLRFSNITSVHNQENRKISKIKDEVKQETSHEQKRSVQSLGLNSITGKDNINTENADVCSPNYKVAIYAIGFVLLLNLVLKILKIISQ